jgi:hypothetical protein
MRPACGIAAFALVACLLPAPVRAQVPTTTPGSQPGTPKPPAAARPRPAATCQVEGVWGLVSVTEDGQEQPHRGYRQRKIVARGHFMWIGVDARRDTITIRTTSDSLRARQVSGGTGTYSLAGNTYTEHLDYFFLPRMEGQDFPATCRTEGDRWFHTYPMDANSGSKRMKVEVWRRIR